MITLFFEDFNASLMHAIDIVFTFFQWKFIPKFFKTCTQFIQIFRLLIVSQTLFGNPKGPVELGNLNTFAENKAVSKFYFIPAQEVVLL